MKFEKYLKPTDKKNYYYFYEQEYPFIICKYKHYYAIMTSSSISKHLKDKLYALDNPYIKESYAYKNEIGVIISSKDEEKIYQIMKDLVSLFHEEKMHPLCHITKQEGEVIIAYFQNEIEIINKDYFYKHQNDPISSDIEKGLPYFIMSLLLPILLWITCHDFGYLIVLDGFLFSLLSLHFYHKKANTITIKSISILTCIQVMSLLLAQFLSLPLTIKDSFLNLYHVSISYIEALSLIPTIFDLELLGTMSVYLLLTVIIILLGNLYFYRKHKNLGYHKEYLSLGEKLHLK